MGDPGNSVEFVALLIGAGESPAAAEWGSRCRRAGVLSLQNPDDRVGSQKPIEVCTPAPVVLAEQEGTFANLVHGLAPAGSPFRVAQPGCQRPVSLRGQRPDLRQFLRLGEAIPRLHERVTFGRAVRT